VTAEEPVLLSIHSTGAVEAVLEDLERRPPKAAILHWFSGTDDQAKRAVRAGWYFSVNVAMRETMVAALPPDRVLPETDFPSTRRHRGAARPGDVDALESRLSAMWGIDTAEVRARLFRNLRAIAASSGAIERLPETLANLLVLA